MMKVISMLPTVKREEKYLGPNYVEEDEEEEIVVKTPQRNHERENKKSSKSSRKKSAVKERSRKYHSSDEGSSESETSENDEQQNFDDDDLYMARTPRRNKSRELRKGANIDENLFRRMSMSHGMSEDNVMRLRSEKFQDISWKNRSLDGYLRFLEEVDKFCLSLYVVTLSVVQELFCGTELIKLQYREN